MRIYISLSSLLIRLECEKECQLIQRPFFSLLFFDGAPVRRWNIGNHMIEISYVIPVVVLPQEATLSNVLLLARVFDIVGCEAAVLAVFDNRLGRDVNVEVALRTRMYT